jgi:hypothetical protein
MLPWWFERALLLVGGIWFVFMDGIENNARYSPDRRKRRRRRIALEFKPSAPLKIQAIKLLIILLLLAAG